MEKVNAQLKKNQPKAPDTLPTTQRSTDFPQVYDVKSGFKITSTHFILIHRFTRRSLL